MLFNSILGASLLLCICHAAPSPPDATRMRIRSNHDPLIRDSMILSHLEATTGLKPERTQMLDGGEYEEYFVVEPTDYDAAYLSLMASNNASSVAEIGFSHNENASGLQKRDIVYSALCYQEGTMGYVQVIGQVLPTICTEFTFAVGYAGKTQIIRRYGLNDVNGNRMVLVVSYAWHGFAFASANACASTLSYYISEYCENEKNGRETTRGGSVTAEQENNCDSSPCPVRADASIDPRRA
ncbi:hypothetical protein HBI12_240830 [Parastagonospora nodorum]|nr:hypothetical protein HBI12_240830 [Parastagonospora nodorum]KAH5395087.1 hypothetical protein HBI47_235320 [Parastagonospora nodorum]